VRKAPATIMVLAVCALTLIACGHGPTAAQTPDTTLQECAELKAIIERRLFIFEPTIMEDPNTGKRSGVFIDMIESIAKGFAFRWNLLQSGARNSEKLGPVPFTLRRKFRECLPRMLRLSRPSPFAHRLSFHGSGHSIARNSEKR
jgi:hypothetical protein